MARIILLSILVIIGCKLTPDSETPNASGVKNGPGKPLSGYVDMHTHPAALGL